MIESVATFSLAGAVLGAALGVALERNHYCTMGAVSDVVLFGSWRRARIWLGAIAIAGLIVQGGAVLGFVDPGTPLPGTGSLTLALLGGAAFGIGMVLAGGCAARLLVRAASGSVAALLAFGVMTLVAGIGAAATPAIGATGPTVPALGLALAAAGLAWVLLDRHFRTSLGSLGMAALLGGTVGLGFVVTAGGDVAVSVNFLPGAATTAAAGTGAVAFALGLVAATFGAAAISAWRGGRWAWRGPVDGGDLLRHGGGAVAMGVGGGIVGGCTIGTGIGAAAWLAPTAWLALVGMAVGAAGCVHVLASGGWAPALRALWGRA